MRLRARGGASLRFGLQNGGAIQVGDVDAALLDQDLERLVAKRAANTIDPVAYAAWRSRGWLMHVSILDIVSLMRCFRSLMSFFRA